MELSLINKYQPKMLNNFELNEDLKLILTTFLEINSLNILFIGDSGSGKSTLIKAIINEYFKDNDAVDIDNNILYINSLKEQGISYYRSEVKTFCQTTSSISKKKKILILDDIDIINEQSQQVFRNCIDKYSHNVNFIASCVNAQKVIESLQSRMNILKIKSFENEDLLKILNNISLKEDINIDDNAKKFIISISNNSVRIMINYLEKFKLLNKNITLDIANSICTNIIYSDFIQYTNYCINKDINLAKNTIINITKQGYSVMDILDNYFLFIKSTDLLDEEQKYNIIKYLCKYISIFHSLHEDEIELVFFTNNLIKIL